MNEVEKRLKIAVGLNLDPAIVSPEDVKFAWFPVYGWDYVAETHRMLWLEKVIRFRPLGLISEYFTYAGSEKQDQRTEKWLKGI